MANQKTPSQPKNNNDQTKKGQNPGSGGGKQQNGQGNGQNNWKRNKTAKKDEAGHIGQGTGTNATPLGNNARVNAPKPGTEPIATELSPEPPHRGPPISPVKDAAPAMPTNEAEGDKRKEPAAAKLTPQQQGYSATGDNDQKITLETLESIEKRIARLQGEVADEKLFPRLAQQFEERKKDIVDEQMKLQAGRIVLLTALRHDQDTKEIEIEIKRKDSSDSVYSRFVSLDSYVKQLKIDITTLENKIKSDGGVLPVHTPRELEKKATQPTDAAASDEGKEPGATQATNDVPAQSSVAKETGQETTMSTIEDYPQFMRAGLRHLVTLGNSLVEKRRALNKISQWDNGCKEQARLVDSVESNLRSARVSVLKEWELKINGPANDDPELKEIKLIGDINHPRVLMVVTRFRDLEEQVRNDKARVVEREAEAAKEAADIAEAEEEKKREEKIANATKKAEEAAEKKIADATKKKKEAAEKEAKEAAEKKAKEAAEKKAKEAAEEKTKEAAEEMAKEAAEKKASTPAMDFTAGSPKTVEHCSSAAEKITADILSTEAPIPPAAEVPYTAKTDQIPANTTESPASKESTEELSQVKAELKSAQARLQSVSDDLLLMTKQKQEWQQRAFTLMQQANYHLQPLHSMINSTMDIQNSLQQSPTFMSRFNAGENDGDKYSVENSE